MSSPITPMKPLIKVHSFEPVPEENGPLSVRSSEKKNKRHLETQAVRETTQASDK
jgi:hypothetical protein